MGFKIRHTTLSGKKMYESRRRTPLLFVGTLSPFVSFARERAVRLTLRTLLAYLDDTLEPAQAKAIGQKIAESPTAQELIARIKEVVRRRRLTTPPATDLGAKLDPNTVAEYIDSVLPGDQLAEVEETALNSDVYLAEIAACHQILTVVLSEPALVPPTARQRMYGLVKGPEAIPYRKAGSAAVAVESPRGRIADSDERDETLLLGLPLYRGEGAWYRRVAPLAGVLLLILLLALAIWKALPHGSAVDRGSPEPAIAKDEARPGENVANPPARETAEETKPPVRPVEETKPTPAPSEPTPAPPPPPEETKPAPKPSPEETKPVPPPAEASKDQHLVVGKYLSPAEAEPNILLHRPTDQAPWQRLIHNNPVHTGEQLVSLPGYRSRVHLDRGVDLLLWGSLPDETSPVLVLESAVVLHDSPDIDLTLVSGRIGLTNPSANPPKRIRLRFQEEAWELTLEGGGEVAAELSGIPAYDFSREPGKTDAPLATLGLFVLRGQANLKVRYDNHYLREPKGPALFFWRNPYGPAPAPQNLDRLPPWANKQLPRNLPPKTPLTLEALSQRLKGQSHVDVLLSEMVKESDKASQQIGTYALGAISDLPDLLEVLTDEHHADARNAAIETLRHWLARGMEQDAKLYQALAAKYRGGPAEIIMSLLHGFSPDTRGKPELYEQLIEYLKNDKLPIRQLAHWQLSWLPETQEIAKRIPYDPAAGIDQREAAYDRWKELIPDRQLPPRNLPPAKPGPKKKDK